MGPRRVVVQLEIETDLSLGQLGRRARWTHDDAEIDGSHWEVRQVQVNVVADKRTRRAKTR